MTTTTPSTQPRIDLAAIRSQQNFALAVSAGIAAAIVGAIGWAVFVYLTDIKFGLVAVAIGALVGYAVRTVGKGVDRQFGILGAVCAAFGWALGTMLCDLAELSKMSKHGMMEIASVLGMSGIAQLFVQAADVLDLVFLAIAVWEGYKLSYGYRALR